MKKGTRREKTGRIRTAVILAVIVAISVLLQTQITWMLSKNSANRSSTLLLNQVETVLQTNDENEQSHTEELKETYIHCAETIAYILDAEPETVYDMAELEEIASFQGVDEIHIFDETGTIIAGTVPEYYGYSFDSGEQMGWFRPMLQDKTLTMCQDITPNTAEGKSMMYAIVWNRAGTQMVQVGIEPTRLLAELEENTIANVIGEIPLPENFNLYVIDTETGEITAGTNSVSFSADELAVYAGRLEKLGTGAGGIIRHNGASYYCIYRPIDGYIVASVYTMYGNLSASLVPLVVMADFMVIAAVVIYLLFSRLIRSGEEKERHMRRLAEDEDIIRAAGHGIWRLFLDADGRIVGMAGNEQWKRIYGAEGTDMTRKECLDYFVSRLVNPAESPVGFSYADMDPSYVMHYTFAWNHPEKGMIYVAIAGTKYTDPDGRVQISGYAEDVTEQTLKQQQWEQALIEARESAEAANSAKTSFLFNMSHDIRTPMNAILGFRDLLEKHWDEPEKRADYLAKIKDAGNVLLSIINNVLEMARIEKGTLQLEDTVCPVEQFGDELASVFKEMMEQKGLTFTRSIHVRHYTICCDTTKMREILMNILSNAYKYTLPGGSIHLHLEELPSDREGWALYRTTVTDTGIGMSEEFLPHVFEEFAREQNTTDARVEGTGLGMPIVKRLVELMGGTIEVSSKKGEGSCFTVTLPHRIAEEQAPAEQDAEESAPVSFAGRRILLAEDNDLNAEIAETILDEAGFLVERAEDGVIVCDMLAAAADGYYDLILMDIQMPNRNGLDAARVIRQMPDRAKADIPIIAMTANAFEEDRREAFRAGMNGHLAKPVDVAQLMKTLADILARK